MQTFLKSTAVLLIGLAVGGALGLYVGWVVWPTEFSDANPAVLQRPYQETYVQMVADTYSSDADLDTARIRLGELGLGYEALVLDTVNSQLLQQDQNAARRTAVLARDLGLSSPAVDSLVNTGAAP